MKQQAQDRLVHASDSGFDRLNKDWYVDKAVQSLMFIGGISAIVFIIAIFVFIAKEGLGFLSADFDWKEFLFSPNWRPTSAKKESYGILALIAGTATLAVPSLWYFDVGNTLARKYPETAPEQLRLLRRIGLREQAWSQAWQVAIFELTRRYEVTFYDASYHALAIVTGGRFVTADEKHLARAGDAGHLIHLRDWRPA